VIVEIVYNHQNLPTFIDFGTKGSISYEYNAAGAKLRKTVTETGKPTRRTDYIGGLVYENDTLKFVPTAEGRMVNSVEKGLLYQYHYKDHLGNVRMTFAPDVPQTERLSLTAEVDSLAKEQQNFTNLTPTRTAQAAYKGNHSVILAREKGMLSSKAIQVEQGGSFAYNLAYKSNETNFSGGFNSADRLKTSKILAGAASALSMQDLQIGNENKSKLLNFNLIGLLPIAKYLLKPTKASRTVVALQKEKPQASISFRVYEDSTLSVVVWEKTVALQEAFDWKTAGDSVEIPKDGYLVALLKNENDKETLLDELELRVYGTEKATIIQENHYEPFGMTLRGLDYVLNPAQKNQFLFGGKELTEDLSLEGYDFVNRGYDPQRGTFNQIDPLADKMRRWTPYHYCFNNPLRFIDPDGMKPQDLPSQPWEVKNSWNEEYIDKYRSYVADKVADYIKDDKKFSCEDLSLSLIIDFAKENNLPFNITNGSGTYDVSNYQGNFDDFKNDILTTTGASDVQNNTVDVKTGEAKAGDIVLLDQDGNNKSDHVQVITKTYQPENTDTQFNYIQQGNQRTLFEGSSITIGSGNPRGDTKMGISRDYTGTTVSGGVWRTEGGQFQWLRSDLTGNRKPDKLNPTIKSWNFNGFNK
jgi:RHS repeat-associated protein